MTFMSTKIFLSYAHTDKELAGLIAQKLVENGLEVWIADGINLGDDLIELIGKEISASDYVLVLLTPNSVVSMKYLNESPTLFSLDWVSRGVAILPVVFGIVEASTLLNSNMYFSLKTTSDDEINSLARTISLIKYLDFSKLESHSFTSLIEELLAKMGFKDIATVQGPADTGVDIIAHSTQVDVAEENSKETWLVELKLYNFARADTQSIYKLAYSVTNNTVKSKGMLITNSQLTSAALQALQKITDEMRVKIRIIDGAELKNLLLQHEDLVNKYFVKNAAR